MNIWESFNMAPGLLHTFILNTLNNQPEALENNNWNVKQFQMYQDQCYLQPCLLWETLPKDSWRDLKYFLYNIWYGRGGVDVLCLHNNYRIERQSIIFLFNLIMQTRDQGVSAVYEPCIMLMISHSSYLIRCALISFYFIQCTAMISLHLLLSDRNKGRM